MKENTRSLNSVRVAALVTLTLLAQGFMPLSADEIVKTQSPLYTRLGGYDAIVAVTEDLLPRLMADPVLGRFWSSRGKDGLAREKQLVINFIVAKSGGPMIYTGRDLKGSHIGMKITNADWRAFMQHLSVTLDKFQVPTKERVEVTQFFESTKVDLVE